MNRWSIEMGKEKDPARPDEKEMRELQEIGTQYGECMVRAMAPGSELPSSPSPGTPLGADALIKQAFDQAGSAYSVSELQLSYVRADGVIDPTYGTAEVHFGKPKRVRPADDPNRPIGAPVPVDQDAVDEMMAKCPVYSWKAGARTQSDGMCMSLGQLARPRCSVLEVWKQAIEAGAPATGLAVLELEAGEQQSWTFSISDGPRDIHFAKSVPDVCDPTLEKPVPMTPPAKPGVKPNPY